MLIWNVPLEVKRRGSSNAEWHGRALKSIHPVDKMMARAIAGFLMECSFLRRGVAHAGGCMVQCAPDGDQVEGR
jgi:hypothetical protein